MRVVVVLACVLALGACSAAQRNYEPVVDLEGSNRSGREYSADLRGCQDLASQRSPARDTAISSGVGALAGAATGALLGTIRGKPAHGLWQGAALGGLGGLGYGAYQGWTGQEQMVANCLRGRGYSVLGG